MSPASDAVSRRPRVVLSAHLDDAVLSAWHVLTSPFDVRVVTVFAGVPDGEFVSPLDRLGGAAESAERVRERRDDDRAALAVAGREPTHLNLLDAQYRAQRIPSLREAIERDPARFIPLAAAEPRVHVGVEDLEHALHALLAEDAVFYTPAGIGGHPDHRDLARLGVWLAGEGRSVWLYADNPYYLRYGLPSWLTDEQNPRADAFVEAELAALSEQTPHLERHVVTFEPAEVEEKLRAGRLYETEFDRANADFGGVMTDRNAMRFEVYWTVAGSAS